jgi:hypothetical protein
MKTSHIVKNLNKIVSKHYDTIYAEADKIRNEIIIPFCVKHKCDFISGGGGYFMVKETSKNIDYDFLEKHKQLDEMLRTPIDEKFAIGDMITDVRYKDFSK